MGKAAWLTRNYRRDSLLALWSCFGMTYLWPDPGSGEIKRHQVNACERQHLLGNNELDARSCLPLSLLGRRAGYRKVCLGAALGTAKFCQRKACVPEVFPTRNILPETFSNVELAAEHFIHHSDKSAMHTPPRFRGIRNTRIVMRRSSN